MADPFLGALTMFASPIRIPSGWAACDGQLLAISQHQALFSLLGTMYGGDGRSIFGLPEMRGRIPVHRNLKNPSGVLCNQGKRGGSEEVSLSIEQMPRHSHYLQASTSTAISQDPAGNVLGKAELYTTATSQDLQPLIDSTISKEGLSLPHSNMMPALVIQFIIAMQGAYPDRN